MAKSKTELDIIMEGLVMMIVFTTVWTISSEGFFNNSDHSIVGFVFGIIILYQIYNCAKLKIYKKSVSASSFKSGKINGKLYFIAVAVEVIAILTVLIILVSTGNKHFIVSSIALIVGLHFLPMAKIFSRKFDYYIGFWTIIISIIGLILISKNEFDYKIVNAFVCLGCAISTSTYGFKMVKDGNLIMKEKKSRNTATNTVYKK